jgi:hypothetical protein
MANENKLRRFSVRFSQKLSAWMSVSAHITSSYNLQELNKSNNQRKPHV